MFYLQSSSRLIGPRSESIDHSSSTSGFLATRFDKTPCRSTSVIDQHLLSSRSQGHAAGVVGTSGGRSAPSSPVVVGDRDFGRRIDDQTPPRRPSRSFPAELGAIEDGRLATISELIQLRPTDAEICADKNATVIRRMASLQQPLESDSRRVAAPSTSHRKSLEYEGKK